jgi:2-polyprenyl-3-methyl-5-hydroxy-6-metoxy-1,4-benzoquinol methylase
MDDQPREVPCALCGARDTRRMYTKFAFGIERCRRCRLVYANPRAPEARILARYSSEYFWNEYLPAVGAPRGQVDLDWLDRRHAPMLDLIRRASPKGRRLLEVGTGAGLFLKAASRASWDVSGLELSAEAAAFARNRLALEVREERAETMTYPAGTFDVAVMFDVVEHLFDPRGVLSAIRKALKPGGILVVSTPNFNALSRAALGVDWAVLSPLEHTYYFTQPTLGAMLEACGFSPPAFVRRFQGWGAVETMNSQYTHATSAWRAVAYRLLVRTVGPLVTPVVQQAGRADALLCIARAS